MEHVVRIREVPVGPSQERGAGLFRIIAMVAPGKTPAELEAAIYEEIEKVKAGPIAEWEIEKARNTARRSLVGTLQSSLFRSIQMAEDALYFDDPGRINTRPARIAAVTAADVQRAAAAYLVPQTRTVVITNPKAQADQGGAQ